MLWRERCCYCSLINDGRSRWPKLVVGGIFVLDPPTSLLKATTSSPLQVATCFARLILIGKTKTIARFKKAKKQKRIKINKNDEICIAYI